MRDYHQNTCAYSVYCKILNASIIACYLLHYFFGNYKHVLKILIKDKLFSVVKLLNLSFENNSLLIQFRETSLHFLKFIKFYSSLYNENIVMFTYALLLFYKF